MCGFVEHLKHLSSSDEYGIHLYVMIVFEISCSDSKLEFLRTG